MHTKSYKDLIVWQKALVLTEEIYALTGRLPREETYGLAAQMRRAAVSIPSNTAEGSSRKDLPEYLYFLRIARGSVAELETQVILAKRLYPALEVERCTGLLIEVQKMLNVMITKLGARLRTRYNKSNTFRHKSRP